MITHFLTQKSENYGRIIQNVSEKEDRSEYEDIHGAFRRPAARTAGKGWIEHRAIVRENRDFPKNSLQLGVCHAITSYRSVPGTLRSIGRENSQAVTRKVIPIIFENIALSCKFPLTLLHFCAIIYISGLRNASHIQTPLRNKPVGTTQS